MAGRAARPSRGCRAHPATGKGRRQPRRLPSALPPARSRAPVRGPGPAPALDFQLTMRARALWWPHSEDRTPPACQEGWGAQLCMRKPEPWPGAEETKAVGASVGRGLRAGWVPAPPPRSCVGGGRGQRAEGRGHPQWPRFLQSLPAPSSHRGLKGPGARDLWPNRPLRVSLKGQRIRVKGALWGSSPRSLLAPAPQPSPAHSAGVLLPLSLQCPRCSSTPGGLGVRRGLLQRPPRDVAQPPGLSSSACPLGQTRSHAQTHAQAHTLGHTCCDPGQGFRSLCHGSQPLGQAVDQYLKEGAEA